MDKLGDLELNKIYNIDCLKGMKLIPDKSIDMILCDLPYGHGKTACKWDTVIPFEPLWEQYERIIKDNGAIVLFGTQPFTSKLILSNEKLFRYELIYKKTKASGFQLANKMPLKGHENILVFYKKLPTYNPQKIFVGIKDKRKTFNSPEQSKNHPLASGKIIRKPDDGWRHPTTVIEFNNANKSKLIHPTQKPVELFEWLIKTYTNEGEIVLDNCMGSGTTAIACININRKYLGFEIEKEYYDLSIKRIEEHKANLINT